MRRLRLSLNSDSMKLLTPIAALGVVLLISPALHAQAPAGSDTNTLDLLRQTLAEQQRHPDKIIRTPTNAPAPISEFKPGPPAVVPIILI